MCTIPIPVQKTPIRGTLVRALIIAVLFIGLIVSWPLLTPSPARADTTRDDQWQLAALNATAAWRYATGAGITVAVIDSGVDASHPDLAGQVLPGVDLVDGSTDGRVDPVGHGTTVAALIAGRRDDTGVVGIAPDARILPIRVLDGDNRYQDSAVVATAIRWAVDHGAKVINLSLGGPADSEPLHEAIAYATTSDVVVVACTGNTTSTTTSTDVWYPAREPGVVAVTGLAAPASAGDADGAGRADPQGDGSGGPARHGESDDVDHLPGTGYQGDVDDTNNARSTSAEASRAGSTTVRSTARAAGPTSRTGESDSETVGPRTDPGAGDSSTSGSDSAAGDGPEPRTGTDEGSDEPLWAGSLTGPQTVLSAPGVGLLGARPGGYWWVQGTSFAAPIVAATAALVRSKYPEMDSSNVINRLVSTALDLGPRGRDETYGFGEVDPLTALTAEVTSVEYNPLTGQIPLTLPNPLAGRSAPAGHTPLDKPEGAGTSDGRGSAEASGRSTFETTPHSGAQAQPTSQWIVPARTAYRLRGAVHDVGVTDAGGSENSGSSPRTTVVMALLLIAVAGSSALSAARRRQPGTPMRPRSPIQDLVSRPGRSATRSRFAKDPRKGERAR